MKSFYNGLDIFNSGFFENSLCISEVYGEVGDAVFEFLGFCFSVEGEMVGFHPLWFSLHMGGFFGYQVFFLHGFQ